MYSTNAVYCNIFYIEFMSIFILSFVRFCFNECQDIYIYLFIAIYIYSSEHSIEDKSVVLFCTKEDTLCFETRSSSVVHYRK